MRKLFSFLLILACFNLIAQVKPTSGTDRLKTMDVRKELNKKSLLNNTSFRSVGPSVMSGRVVDFEVNPTDPTEFYVAYATGGLWYSVNNGQSFVPIFDSTDIITIGDIAVNWKTRRIWVGTGEVNSSRSTYAGMGVYKSDDNGKTWDYLGLPESHHIGKIQLHATDPNTAWVAALGHLYSPNKDRGIYKTTDAGKTWRVIDTSETGSAFKISFSTSKIGYLLSKRLLRTTDGGYNWKSAVDKSPVENTVFSALNNGALALCEVHVLVKHIFLVKLLS